MFQAVVPEEGLLRKIHISVSCKKWIHKWMQDKEISQVSQVFKVCFLIPVTFYKKQSAFLFILHRFTYISSAGLIICTDNQRFYWNTGS